jgi:molybdopterin-guanine dinucleotide biosynthesis protein A
VGGFRSALDGLPIGVRYAIDDHPGRGPVAGAANGLRVADGALAVVAACDMPTLDPDFLDSLFLDAEGKPGAVPVIEGQRQPFPGVYRVDPATARPAPARWAKASVTDDLAKPDSDRLQGCPPVSLGPRLPAHVRSPPVPGDRDRLT